MKKLLFCLIFLISSLNLFAYECELAACAVFRDEGPYLREWVEFHMAQGVQRFYLYDNLSCDRFYYELEDYICQKIVNIIPWPYEACDCRGFDEIRCKAYMHCIERIKKRVRWCAFIDCNEFLFTKNCLPLYVFLRKFKHYVGLAVNRQVFGTSNIDRAPCGALIRTLFWKCHPKHECCRAVKLIVRPKYVVDCYHPRCFIFKDGLEPVNSNKKPVIDCRTKDILLDKICINQYVFRDLYFFNTFYRRSHCCFLRDWCNLDFCYFDDCIIRCAPIYPGPCCPNQ